MELMTYVDGIQEKLTFKIWGENKDFGDVGKYEAFEKLESRIKEYFSLEALRSKKFWKPKD